MGHVWYHMLTVYVLALQQTFFHALVHDLINGLSCTLDRLPTLAPSTATTQQPTTLGTPTATEN